MGSIRNRGTDDNPLWYVRYVDADGRKVSKPSHQPTKREAKEYLATVESRIAKGVIGIPVPTVEEKARKQITVGELFARFLGDTDAPGYSSPRLKDLEEYRRQVRSMFDCRIAPDFGTRPAASVKSIEIERLREALTAEHYAARSIISTLGALSKVYNWAKRAELIDCDNPCQGIERPRTLPTIDYFDGAEVGALLDAAEATGGMLYPLVAVGIYAGLRKGELFGLRWSDLHLDAGRLDVNRSYALVPKSGKPRHLPLNPALPPILRAWKDRCPPTADRLVFPVEVAPGRYRMGERDNMLGLPELLTAANVHAPAKPWHALRHTFASHFMMARGNILTLQKLLGHGDLRHTLVYAHLAPDFIAEEIGRMAFARPSTAGVSDLDAARAAKVAAEASASAGGH